MDTTARVRVYKRGPVYWCYVLGKRQTTRCTDYEAACLFARRLEREGADPRHAAAHKATLGDAIRELKAELVRRERSASTLKIADQKLGHFARLWGEEMPLANVTASEILRFVDKRLAEGAARMTVRHELAHLRQMLTLARRVGRYPHHWDDVDPKFIAVYKPRTRTLTVDEVRAVIADLADEKPEGRLPLGPARAAHFAFFVATGADVSEAARARRDDVDLRAGVVRVRGTKTAFRSRLVPITPLTRGLLRYVLDHAPGDERLFDRWDNVQRALRLCAQRLEIEHFSPKDLRRTLGTWLRDAGIAPQLISRALGHADAKMAERVYARGHDEAIAAEIRRQLARVQPVYIGNGSKRYKRRPVRKAPVRKSA